MTDRGPVVVLLCHHVALEPKVDLEILRADLALRYPRGTVHVVDGLCEDPARLERLIPQSGATNAVLGLCGGELDERELQAALRRAGLDPLGVGQVDLGTWCRGMDGSLATRKARVLLGAAVAAALAFPGSKPANAKPYLPARLSRRSFLRLPVPAYRAMPSWDPDRCATDEGCHLCVEACPVQAVSRLDGRIRIDTSRCEACGVCASQCPRETLSFPGYSPPEVEARVRALLEDGDGIAPRGILFVCSKATPTGPVHPGWMPVPLACAAMATASWLMAPLLLGATAVGVLRCTGPCPNAPGEKVLRTVEFCRELLAAVGEPEERVQWLPQLQQPPGAGLPAREGRRRVPPGVFRTSPEVVSSVLLQVVESIAWQPELDLPHPGAPTGVVEINPQACTGCGMCGRACPTGALAYREEGGAVSLSFEAARCIGCELCLETCPEGESGAIRVERRFAPKRLREGPTELCRHEQARCVRCGAPVAPRAMLERVMSLLGEDAGPLRAHLTQFCSSCRPLGAPRGGGPPQA